MAGKQPRFTEYSTLTAIDEALTKELRRLLDKGDDLREFVMDDYLVLYLVRRGQVIFLAVKHHRQLSFDLKGFWSNE